MYQTKYLGPTFSRTRLPAVLAWNSHVARVKVTNLASGRYSYVPWDDSLDVEENHTKAFKAFAAQEGNLALGRWVRISMEDGNLYVRKAALRDVE